MPRIANGTYLMVKEKTASDYTPVTPITGIPSLDPQPNYVDVTTLSHHMQHVIDGLKQLGDGLAFPALFDHTEYQRLKTNYVGKELDYAVWIGDEQQADGSWKPTGSDGKWTFKGTMSLSMNAANSGEVMATTVTILPSTDIASE